MEEWISLNQFMKRQNIGYKTVLQMLENKEIDYIRTGTRYKIKVGGNTVSRDIYEKEKERRIQAETKLQMLKDFINELFSKEV